jgi:hypothetical protein
MNKSLSRVTGNVERNLVQASSSVAVWALACPAPLTCTYHILEKRFATARSEISTGNGQAFG